MSVDVEPSARVKVALLTIADFVEARDCQLDIALSLAEEAVLAFGAVLLKVDGRSLDFAENEELLRLLRLARALQRRNNGVADDLRREFSAQATRKVPRHDCSLTTE